ncbi:MAG: hypothetical protein D6682_05485 [Zetaproteobacteria bacterium]|nr:MAG: hypothetical protein D6682_05485 [Zetaproteobacteria bacterium]
MALAADGYEVELRHNRAIQQRLRAARRELQRDDRRLAAQTERLDRQLLAARRELEEAEKAYRRTDGMVRKLQARRASLQRMVQKLQRQIADEAAAAWIHAGRGISWLDLLAGVPVEEIPHRKHMIELLIAAHEEKKNALKLAMEDLATIERRLVERRKELLARKRDREQRRDALRARRAEKRRLLREVRRRMRAGERRLAQLRRREQRLTELLARADTTLTAAMRRLAPRSIRRSKGRLPWPLAGRLVGRYGSRHPVSGRLRGIEIAPRRTREVHSIADGQIKFADWFGGFGLTMVVDYGGGVVAIYAHNDALYHQAGDWVEQGTLIARAGATGWVERPLLYFELRDRGRPVDPLRWLRRRP